MQTTSLLPSGMGVVDATLAGPPDQGPTLAQRFRSMWRLLMPRPGRTWPIVLDDNGPTMPRYGHGKPAHRGLYDLIDAGRGRYAATLQRFAERAESLARIPVHRESANRLGPVWMNRFLPGLDAVALYCFAAEFRPKRYYEVGSGNSTMFMRRSIQDHALDTFVTSFDPEPRAEVDAICDRVVRRPLAEADLSAVLGAEENDIVFLDGSHRVFTGSDVAVAFLEILPRLRPGVIVQIHDIWLPYDYPDRWRRWLYSEQYMLAVALLSAPERYEILLPNMFISSDPELRPLLDPVWRQPNLQGVPSHGGSFWMRLR